MGRAEAEGVLRAGFPGPPLLLRSELGAKASSFQLCVVAALAPSTQKAVPSTDCSPMSPQGRITVGAYPKVGALHDIPK